MSSSRTAAVMVRLFDCTGGNGERSGKERGDVGALRLGASSCGACVVEARGLTVGARGLSPIT
jgi:hypothetical protein